MTAAPPSDIDVLIVGAGIAGASLAAALAPWRRVMLVEAEDALAITRRAGRPHSGMKLMAVRGCAAAVDRIIRGARTARRLNFPTAGSCRRVPR
jgi:2-polyprenyl-6-methoxyphenol hydroxylase-like FAD-dependent oxidoreductase